MQKYQSTSRSDEIELRREIDRSLLICILISNRLIIIRHYSLFGIRRIIKRKGFNPGVKKLDRTSELASNSFKFRIQPISELLKKKIIRKLNL